MIEVFVQVLDSCFENVCELDLIYHFDRARGPVGPSFQMILGAARCLFVPTQVNYILDEIVMAGMVLETNADLILKAVKVRCLQVEPWAASFSVSSRLCHEETKKLEQEGSTFGF